MSLRVAKTRQPQSLLVSSWLAPSAVVSVQTGVTTCASGATTNTTTITAVNTANSIILYLGNSCSQSTSSDWNDVQARVSLTDSTTVTVTRGTATGDATVSASWAVIEFAPGLIRSVQRGTIAGGAPNTATITAVNTTRSTVIYLGQSSNMSSAYGGWTGAMVRVSLTDSTTVTATNAGGGATETVGYQVVEWN